MQGKLPILDPVNDFGFPGTPKYLSCRITDVKTTRTRCIYMSSAQLSIKIIAVICQYYSALCCSVASSVSALHRSMSVSVCVVS